MTERRQTKSVAIRQNRQTATPRSEATYAEWLAEEIAEGCDELDKRRGIEAERVWKKLGLE